ncbi:MAG: glycosyltransferase family 2 protein, partial [Alphaproteobacteria bacterium]|nr:glycosyltransferase family 2 protein [Alphaproteobacteria bacterium]
MSPLISICIPVYNFANFLPETLDAILFQECADLIEIIILDGGSTDNTSEIAERYKNKNCMIKYIALPQKGGIDRDIVHAVSYATADYVWLFSGDDWMLPGALQKALRQISSGYDLYLT